MSSGGFDTFPMDGGALADEESAGERFIEHQVMTMLRADPDVMLLCGGRIYVSRLPQTIVPPAAMFMVRKDDACPTVDGPSALTRALLTFYVYGLTYNAAQLLTDAIDRVLRDPARGKGAPRMRESHYDQETQYHYVIREVSILGYE